MTPPPASQGTALEVLGTAGETFFSSRAQGLHFNSLSWIVTGECVWTEAYIALVEGLWRDLKVSLMGGVCACFLLVGIVEAGHLCLWKNPSFLNIVVLFIVFKGNFHGFCLGKPNADFACSTRFCWITKETTVSLFGGEGAFLPTFSLVICGIQLPWDYHLFQSQYPTVSQGPRQRPEKLIWRFFCFIFPHQLVKKLK